MFVFFPSYVKLKIFVHFILLLRDTFVDTLQAFSICFCEMHWGKHQFRESQQCMGGAHVFE